MIDYGDVYLATTSLDVSAAATFAPGRGAPRFGPATVSHSETGGIGPVMAGAGSPFDSFFQPGAPVPVRGMTDRRFSDGLDIDVEAVGRATPYLAGIPHPAGVFGPLISDAVISYERAPTAFGGGGDVVRGTSLSDAAALGGGDDVFRGRCGADRLNGGGGDDDLDGGSGRDRPNGGAGDDALSGGAGRDTLEGGRGDDSLTGGRGADRFDSAPSRARTW